MEPIHQNPDTEPTQNPTRTSISSPLHVVQKLKQKLIFKSKWAELNGAMGDLGTYIPIVLTLTLSENLNLSTTLIFTGIYNFVTGLIYGVPMPVQPMKSIAAVAISNPSFGIPEVMAAGICTAAILFILCVTGEDDKDDQNDDLKSEDEGRRGSRIMRKLRKIIASLPSAFIVFLLGVVLAIIRGPKAVKVCKLSTDLFPEKDVSATSVSITVGLMNLVGCWFGAMPCCHGAGGLAGQYKFGGRTGGCVALLGVAKLVLGLVVGSSLVKILNQFPVGVLGVLLLFAGIELAMCARDMNSKEEAFVMLVCTAVSLVGSSAALGFLCGMVVHLLVRLRTLGDGSQLSCSTFWFRRGSDQSFV
ncbi:hypothetical protein BUALT_Bualt10G0109200 [Buddleja alternifolia]|uniref:Molybdate transporter 1 n=1 Tax=Buddleja alternifolia TaxID=168488 RepID=A0AAV6X5Z2_9LAMI|nr:hypothetical protein BUALT_Bualt10G0109200 [Buddleja alternifolia]